MQAYTLRLKPEQNLLDEIERFARDQNIEAGCVLCSVGGRTKAMIRPANREFTSAFAGHFEIVSMTGTVSIHGSYLHISISDGDG